MQRKGVFVGMGYGGIIGCVAESSVLSVTEHHNFWGTENCHKKWKIIFTVEYVKVISSLKAVSYLPQMQLCTEEN